MGIYSTKSKWQRILHPLVEVCVKANIHPDWFIAGAIGLSILAGFGLWQAAVNIQWLWLVPIGVLLRLGFNLIDGMVAREMGIASAWGEALNEFGDRMSDFAVFFGLAMGGYVDLRILLLTLALIFLVSYLGILGKATGGARVYGGVFGKGDRMISLAAFSFYALFTQQLNSFNVYLIAGAIAALITILQRLRKIYDHSKSTH